MYAVIESGGKQYRVELGSTIQVDRLDAQPGDSITLDRVLLVADGDATAVGQPVVDGASVSLDVLGQDRGDKVVVFKYKPKARTRVKKGFRAELTTLRVSDIAFGGKSAAKDAKASEAKQAKADEAAAREAEKAAADKAAADRELAAKLAAAAPVEADEATPKARSSKKASAKAAMPPDPEAEATPEEEVRDGEGAAESQAAHETETTAEAETDTAVEPDTAAEPETDAGDNKKDE